MCNTCFAISCCVSTRDENRCAIINCVFPPICALSFQTASISKFHLSMWHVCAINPASNLFNQKDTQLHDQSLFKHWFYCDVITRKIQYSLMLNWKEGNQKKPINTFSTGPSLLTCGVSKAHLTISYELFSLYVQNQSMDMVNEKCKHCCLWHLKTFTGAGMKRVTRSRNKCCTAPPWSDVMKPRVGQLEKVYPALGLYTYEVKCQHLSLEFQTNNFLRQAFTRQANVKCCSVLNWLEHLNCVGSLFILCFKEQLNAFHYFVHEYCMIKGATWWSQLSTHVP